MSHYQLSPEASSDLFSILDNLSQHRGQDFSAQVGHDLIAGFKLLADNPGIGHLREDLTRHPFHLYTLEPYLIVYARSVDPLPILAILHGSRNVAKLLRKRLR